MVESWRSPGTFTRFGEVAFLPALNSSPDLWLAFLELVGTAGAARRPAPDLGSRDGARVPKLPNCTSAAFPVHLPDAGTVEALVDKRAQYELARKEGIPMPRVDYPATGEDAADLADEVSYPCLVKPYVSDMARSTLAGTPFAGKKLFVVQSGSELVYDTYQRLAGLGVTVMIQELVPGTDSALFGYLGFWDGDGRERAWVTSRSSAKILRGSGTGRSDHRGGAWWPS